MNATLTGISLAVAMASSSFAQGYVRFNSDNQNVSTNAIFPPAPGRTQGVGDYYYALFWSASITSGAPIIGLPDYSAAGYAFNTFGWTLDTDPTAVAASTSIAGHFAAVAPNADGSTSIPGTIGGADYYFVIVGWSANLGNSVAALESSLASGGIAQPNVYLGQSAVSGPIQVGDGLSIATPTIMGGADPAIPAFILGPPVPEPGAFVLSVLGGGSLLATRCLRRDA